MFLRKKSMLFAGSLTLSLLYLVGCEDATETVNKAATDLEDAIEVVATKDNEFVESVKNGALNSYPDQPIGDMFENFFSSPAWKYFKADTGEEIVEFTGYNLYRETKVKAKLQFIVDEATGNFEVGALSLNDVPQDELTKLSLLASIYEEEDVLDPDPMLAHNDRYFIEKAQQGYIDELALDTIGNIFSDGLFSNRVWSVDEAANITINGDYNGEIFPGEASNLQFTLAEVEEGLYTIIDLQYNGETVPEDNYHAVTDIILYAISS